MTFKEIFKPPFKTDGVFVYTADDVMALMPADCASDPQNLLERTCEVLNGTKPSAGNPKIGCEGPDIYCNGDLLLVVRGYGYLTGSGGLGLSDIEACEIQDRFAEWVVEQLKGNN